MQLSVATARAALLVAVLLVALTYDCVDAAVRLRRRPPPFRRLPPPGRRPPHRPPAASSPPPPPVEPRARNGIRLVAAAAAGARPRGRLEVSSLDGWLSDQDGELSWRPVCKLGFDDLLAQAMCEMLGFGFGREFYSADVAFRPPNDTAKWWDDPIEYLYCSAALASPPSEGDTSEGHRRRLLAPLTGTVDTPPESPYTCKFRKGTCGYTGPMVGIECADEDFPPAPPPPPRPPTPPDRPPSLQYNIRQIGGYNDIEPNLCEGSEDPDCSFWGRGELLVADPADPAARVWAPICAPTEPHMRYVVADLACKQLVDWPYDGFYSATGDAQASFTIPAEPEAGAEGVFRPSAYRAWVTVTGGDEIDKVAVQQLDLQVTREPCSDGLLLAFSCTYRA